MRCIEVADESATAMTKNDDDRETPIGRQLRKLRIDKLPQIINILKWEMSWIGPRPEAHILSTWYTSEIPFYRYRHVVKPGISAGRRSTRVMSLKSTKSTASCSTTSITSNISRGGSTC